MDRMGRNKNANTVLTELAHKKKQEEEEEASGTLS